MKLPVSELAIEDKLAEFDQWVTPSIQEIQDTEKYKSELEKVDALISSLGESTGYFSDIDHCGPDQIASTCINLIKDNISNRGMNASEMIIHSTDIIESLASLLFMVTGKSDNNLKCQFPVYLAQNYPNHSFPLKTGSKGKVKFTKKSLGRVVKSDKLAKVVSDALVYSVIGCEQEHLISEAKWLLGKYVESILKDSESVRQFWALGRSYFSLKELDQGFERSLLAPIVIFKVRGSVSASGGHIPEDILRGIMERWGMEKGIDFNLDDVILKDTTSDDVSKTRAYDFVLPFQTPGWMPHIFIQCQFYAGDSGSVSHKVVDQTKASRPLTQLKYPEARFIEYLDGAGYYSSLNTDLRHMLGMGTTKEFIQVRSADLKLRRELQDIGFLTPLEIEHAVFKSTAASLPEIESLLEQDGYTKEEIDRSIENATRRGLISVANNHVAVNPDRLAFARRVLLVDITASIGAKTESKVTGTVLIPGYGACFGVQLSLLSEELDVVAPNLEYSRNDFANDINWLMEERLIIMR